MFTLVVPKKNFPYMTNIFFHVQQDEISVRRTFCFLILFVGDIGDFSWLLLKESRGTKTELKNQLSKTITK